MRHGRDWTFYGLGAGIGETVRLDTESFYGDYAATGILAAMGEKEGNTCAIAVSKAALTQWAGFDPAGYRAYVHFQGDRQFDQEALTAAAGRLPGGVASPLRA